MKGTSSTKANNFLKTLVKSDPKCYSLALRLYKEEVHIVLFSHEHVGSLWVREREENEVGWSVLAERDPKTKTSGFKLAQGYSEECHIWLIKK